MGYALSCPTHLAMGMLILLGTLVFLRTWSRRAVLGAMALLVPGLVLAVAAWVLRDRQNILGDAMLWIDWSRSYGLSMPTYNEFLGTRLFGLLGEITQNRSHLKVAFGGISILSGLVCALSVRGVLLAAGEKASAVHPEAVALALALVFLQPLSFVFFGHIESYPVFAAVCSVFLCLFYVYLKTGKRLGLVLLTLLGSVACHTMGLVLCVSFFGLLLHRHKQPPRVVLFSCAGFVAVSVFIVASIPALRSFTILQGRWHHHFSPAYLTGLLNAWFLLLLSPVLLLAPLGRRIRPLGDFEWFLFTSFCLYMLLPLAVTWKLGFYSDLDLLTPAFVLGCFYVGLKLWTSREAGSRLPAVRILPGMTLLLAWLTTSQCPAGLRMFEDQARAGALTIEGRVYSLEEAAYFRRNSGDRIGALALLEEAIGLSPGSKRLRGPIGELQLALGDTTGAIASLEELWEVPGRGQYMALLAQGLVENGRPRLAVSVLQPHLDQVLREGGQAAALAAAYIELGRPDSTLIVSQQRSALAPDDDVAHFNQAAALVRMGREMEALEQLHNAAKLNPTNLTYQLTLVRLTSAVSGAVAAEEYMATLPRAIRDAVIEHSRQN